MRARPTGNADRALTAPAAAPKKTRPLDASRSRAMPHLVIDYSGDDLTRDRIAPLLQQLAVTAAATGVMQAADIKVRARGFDDYLVAGRRDSFVHLAVFMLAGRTPAQKLALSTALRQTLVEHCPDIHSLSVDIRDMDPEAYKKRLKGA